MRDLVWLIPLFALVVNRANAQEYTGRTTFTAGRTKSQREELCREFARRETAWNDFSIDRNDNDDDYWPSVYGNCQKIPIRFTASYLQSLDSEWTNGDTTAGCRKLNYNPGGPVDDDDSTLSSVRCKTAENIWCFFDSTIRYSYYDGSDLETEFLDTPDSHDLFTAFGETTLNRNDFPPATCSCGQDYPMEGVDECVDIDECKESFTCPALSKCENLNLDYTCRCDPGYFDEATGSAYTNKVSGVCVPSYGVITIVSVEYYSFTYKIEGLTVGLEAKVDLYYIVEDGEDYVEQAGKKFTISTSIVTATFENLLAGARYRVVLTIYSANSDIVSSSDMVITKCYCQEVNGDQSGIPTDIRVSQLEGFVTFEFTDNSRCEDAYSFSRGISDGNGDYSEWQSFAPDYYYFSSEDCSTHKYAPGRQATDDLSNSKLTVGEEYAYQIRAVSRRPWRSSEWARVVHQVLWQASIDGMVSLAESSGGLPISSVTVQYRLEDSSGNVIPLGCPNLIDTWCWTTTSRSGKYKIDLSLVNPVLNNNDEYPLRMRFAKTTGEVIHRFLCNEGSSDCSYALTPPNSTPAPTAAPTSSPTSQAGVAAAIATHTAVVYLSHLEFNSPFHVIDDTTVPLRGIVTVKGTEMPGAGALGCPIVGGRVCLKHVSVRNTVDTNDPACVETDSNGEYALPAVIGTTVSPFVDFYQHEFEPIDPSYVDTLAQGTLISPNEVYEGYNFHDVTTNSLTIEVAGGLCNRFLGNTDIQLTMQGCPWTGQTLSSTDVKAVHQVIAHTVELRVVSVQDPTPNGGVRQEITDALSPSQDAIVDLRELEQVVNAGTTFAPSPPSGIATAAPTAFGDGLRAAEQEVVKRLARFQYDGTDAITVVFGNMGTQGCGSSAAAAGVASYSYHVVKSFSSFDVFIMVKQVFGYGIGECSTYPEGTTISIQNQMGILDGFQSDENWIEQFESQPGTADKVEQLRLCNPSCSQVLVMDAFGENANVLLRLAAGQPNPFGDMTKPFFVTMDKSGVRHKSDVLITGQWKLSDRFTVALPDQAPIMVLRDPPGGGSYAYYENVITTIQVKMEHYEVYRGVEGNLAGIIGGWAEASACVGGVVASACVEVGESAKKSRPHAEYSNLWLGDLEENTNTATYTTTWSYATSADPWTAGKQSDVFLVPSFNVKFSEVTEVMYTGFNATTAACAIAVDKLTFSLEDPGNKPAIAFLSRYDIESVEISELQRLYNATATCKANPTALSCDANVSNKEYDEKLASLDKAIKDWQRFLKDHDEVNEAATNGTLKNFTVDYFQKTAGIDHYAGLTPKKLAEGVTIDPLTAGGDSVKLASVNLIKFDGGGSSLQFEIGQEAYKEQVRKAADDAGKWNERDSFTAGVDGEGEFKVPGGLLLGFEVGLAYHSESDGLKTQTNGSSDGTTIGFVLSDPDAGDVFDVEVFMDPKYHTLVFNTVGGRSKCPTEDNTVPREQPHIQLKSGPSVPLLPDAEMVFEVELTNQGISTGAFMVHTDQRTNTGLLRPRIGGGDLSVAFEFTEILARETITTSVSFKRGPVQYDNPAQLLQFFPACDPEDALGNAVVRDETYAVSLSLFNVIDPTFPEGQQERIRFARPCPGIKWAGSLAYDRSFRVNLASRLSRSPKYTVKVMVQNPNASIGSFNQTVQDSLSRLEDAGLWFRRIGTVTWSPALYRPRGETTDAIINFTQLAEDDFGYISVDWNVVGLSDGEYEIEARTLCENTGGLPTDFNFAATERLRGVIDRSPPLFLSVAPSADDPIYPGDVMRFEFTEVLQCSTPHVFALTAKFDKYPLRLYDNQGANNLLVSCEGRTISVRFDPAKVDLSRVMNATFSMNMTGVQDLNENPIDKSITKNFTTGVWTARGTTTRFLVDVNGEKAVDGTGRRLVGGALENSIRQQISSLAQVSLERVQVAADAGGEGHNNVGYREVSIKPPKNPLESDALSAYHSLFQDGDLKLFDHGSFIIGISELEVELGPEDHEDRRRRRLAIENGDIASHATDSGLELLLQNKFDAMQSQFHVVQVCFLASMVSTVALAGLLAWLMMGSKNDKEKKRGMSDDVMESLLGSET